VTVSTGGVITGFNFVPGAAAAMTSPTSVPLHLMALEKAAQPADSGDSALRSAIVNVAGYYLRLAQTRSPAQMESLIWGKASLDGADHGPSCAAFASLTLELAAQAVGQQSWVTGGATYPWPLHQWADVRVDPNPGSLSITSMVQDAQANQRWHPVGDGYQPQPGDWVLFSQHVEVVTSYSGGVLDTIGADSLPNFTVNSHSFPGPLAGQGVEGFVDNGHLVGQPSSTAQGTGAGHATQRHNGQGASQPAQPASVTGAAQAAAGPDGASSGQGTSNVGLADIPGAAAPMAGLAIGAAPAQRAAPAAGAGDTAGSGSAAVSSPAAAAGGAAAPGRPRAHGAAASQSSHGADIPKGTANIPGAQAAAGLPALAPRAPGQAAAPAADPVAAPAADPVAAAAADPVAAPKAGGGTSAPSAAPKAPYRKYGAPDRAPTPGTKSQQAFINQIAPGAIAAQQRYGVPASVTIAQAIDESGWGGSALAAQDHNLFGIKGTGPAGAVSLPTQEYFNGQWVTINAAFRVYHNIAESIADHAELLATSGYYQRAMADRAVPDAFANDLTGVYATDPEYGANIIALMRLYNLYRFDSPAAHQQTPAGSQPPTAHPPADHGATAHAPAGQAPIPGAMPAAAAAPAGPATAAIPGTAIFPDGTSVSGASVPSGRPVPGSSAGSGSSPVPGGTAIPGTSTVPSNTAVTSSTAIPGSAAVPGDTSIPGGAAVPGSAAVLGAALAPGSLRGRRRTPGRPSAAGRPSTPGRSAANGRQTVAARPSAARGPSVEGGPSSAAAVWTQRTTTATVSPQPTGTARIPGLVAPMLPRYRAQFPAAVATAFFASAKTPLARAEPLYRDVADEAGIPWELLAACDWMQCQADRRYSPVRGEKIGALNPDGTVYQTKSEALAQCASDLIELAGMVYRIDLTAPGILSVRALADAFAAFRWGGLLKRHRVSAMEFPYSVAGLTVQHMKMHWPAIKDPDAPDRPGGRFRKPFGAVPVVLSLHYPATVLSDRKRR
jgi:flagellum-specific peptidoglycan hydrolase FlgJ